MRVSNIFENRSAFQKGNISRCGAQMIFPNFRSSSMKMSVFEICWLEESGEWIVQDLNSLRIYLMDTKSETPEKAVGLMAGWKWSKKKVEDIFPEFPEIACKTPQKTKE